jgi:hypothetical protein
MTGDPTSAIYPPPREGLPFLVITVANEEIVACTPAVSRDEARSVLTQQRTFGLRAVPRQAAS